MPHNLPAALTSLVGRDGDLATIAGLLGEHRLVTLVGSGGCGKTRLAQHAAADVVDQHPAGTWWVELAPLTEETQIADAVAAALGLGTVIGVDVTVQVVRHLSDAGPTLVVLDNAEHLLDGVARLTDRLLSSCPAVRVVVTSREALGIASEVIWRVPSLIAPPRTSASRPTSSARSLPSACSWSGPVRHGPTLSWTRSQRRVSRPSAPGSTASRSLSNWPPHGSDR